MEQKDVPPPVLAETVDEEEEEEEMSEEERHNHTGMYRYIPKNSNIEVTYYVYNNLFCNHIHHVPDCQVFVFCEL